MFNAYIITTINAFDSNKVKTLTARAENSCKQYGIKPILFDAVVPATLEKYYPGWPVREDYRERKSYDCNATMYDNVTLSGS